ncbi:MAG: endonuclease/exonuclease/phosphatase family protein [Bacteriovoracaceae bacterium]|nr:endonuclease/exonuclease/phosphatase family protein [Bacteriovoracaceae bacterium]
MLCVMSTNIRFSNPHDGENDWPNRKDFLASLVKRESPVLLGTQEGREPQIRELQDLIPELQLVDGHRDWIEERMYPCIFVDTKRFDILESGDIWLSSTPDVAGSKSFNSAFPRLCTFAQLKEKSSGLKMTYANCHLDHVEEETRIEQAKVLCLELRKKLTKGNPLIISGDFNTSPQSKVRKILTKEIDQLNDPWINQNLPEETSFHKFDGEDPDGSASRIDWILHQAPLRDKLTYLVKEHRNGLYPSDHFFVVSHLEY